MAERKSWFLCLVALLFVAAILFCPAAKAQTEVRFEILPPGTLGIVDGHYYRLYTLEEFKELAKYDNELFQLRLDTKDQAAIVTKLEEVVKGQKAKIWTLEKDKDILAQRSIRLDSDLDKCEGEKIALAGGSVWPYVVGAVGAVVGVVGVTMWASNR